MIGGTSHFEGLPNRESAFSVCVRLVNPEVICNRFVRNVFP